MSGSKAIAGVLPVFQTPWNEDESLDRTTLQKEIEWLFEAGSDGVVLGMVSEVLRLSAEERRELGELACHFSRGRGVAILSVGAESSKVAAEFARHAEGCGAAAVMAAPPIAIAIGEDQLLGYYERILQATSLPVVVQDASGYVGRPMSIEFLARIQRTFGSDRVVFKPEAVPIGPRLSALREATGGQARILEGTGGIALVDSFRRGVVGTMPGADLIHGIVALWQALVRGDEERVYQISLPLSALVAVQSSLDAFLAVEKHLLVRQGVFVHERVRGPVGYTLDDETRREVDRLFDVLTAAIGAKR